VALGIALFGLGPGLARAQSDGVISFARTISVPSYGTWALVLSPDGRFLATNADVTTRVFAIAEMHEVANLAHPKEMYALTFSPDGAMLVASGNGAVAWSTGDWKQRWSLPAPAGSYLGPVAFTPDARTLYSTGNSQLLAREATNGKAGESVALGNTPVSAIAISPNGAFIAAGSSGGGLRLVAAANHSVMPIADKTHYPGTATAAERAGSLAHPGHIEALAFSSDGALLASSAGDGTIKLWDLRKPPFEKPVWRIVCGADANGLTFERGDRLLDAGCGRAILRIDVRTGTIAAWLRSHGKDVSALAPEPDGIHLWSSSYDGTLKRWDVMRGDNVATYGAIDTAALSADGKTFAFGRGDDAIVLIDPATERTIATLRGNVLPLTLGSYSYSRGTLALASDGAYVAGGGYITSGFIDHTGVAGGVARVWRRGSAQPLQTWNGVAPETLTFSADGSHVGARSPAMSDTASTVWSASISSSSAVAWVPRVKAEGFCWIAGFNEAQLAPNPRPALLISFGECLASTPNHPGENAPGRLRFWPVGASAPDAPFAGEPIGTAALALSPDRRRALSVGARVTLWDTVARRATASAPLVPLNKNESVQSVALGGNVAVGLLQTDLWRTDDRWRYALVVWDGRTGRQLARTAPRAAGERIQLLLSGDGTRAYVTTPAGIEVWELKSGAGRPIL
jgi:WD40 repeat protein